MAGFSKFGRIAQELARNPKVRQALQNPKTKQTGAKLVERAADAADKATKGKHTGKIQRARNEARKRLMGGDGSGNPGIDGNKPSA
jgi:hypothetical protein